MSKVKTVASIDVNVSSELAIVGIGCRYPGDVNSVEDLWNLLISKRDGFKFIPESRWSASRHVDKDKNAKAKMSTDQAAFIDDSLMFEFDPDFFNMSSHEADVIDPQQRLLHEVCWECLEDARVPASLLSGKNVGVYVGAFSSDFDVINRQGDNFNQYDQFSATSSTSTMLSNRLSYSFNFKGPSLTIDTACSSSMVAFNYACQDLRAGNAEVAIVAGVNAMLYPSSSTVMSVGGFLSPDCRSKAFDAKANGYARGEGAGAVLVKRLSDAIKDGNEIYAVVKGCALNQDGKTIGIAAPSGHAQQKLIEKVLSDYALNADDVVLVEAHGTGTALGDPTEVSALANALGERKNGQKRLISSIKGNIGHQEGGAGIAGIIKASLALKYNCAPVQCNFDTLNPSLDLSSGSFEVTTQSSSLPFAKGQSLACVNSFGYGGTNGHAVLGQWQNSKTQSIKHKINDKGSRACLIVLSAKDQNALRQRAADIKALLQSAQSPCLSQLSQTLLCDVEHFDYRIAFVAQSSKNAIDWLDKINREEIADEPIEQNVSTPSSTGAVFVFTGMGPQWCSMGQELYNDFPVFRKAVKKADKAFLKSSGWSILAEMFKHEDESTMGKNEIAQPANFILQYGLSQLLQSMGLYPDAITGHSVGEVGAALASGALSLKDAAKVAYQRSRIQQKKAGQGRMLATGLDLDTAFEIEALYKDRISVGAINSAQSVAMAGDIDSLSEISQQLKQEGIITKLIFGEVAYHSHQMEDLKTEVLSSLEGVKPRKPKIKLYSTITTEEVDCVTHNAQYWWKNIRQPVQFHQTMKNLVDAGYKNFIEIGPSPVLAGAIQQIFAEVKSATPTVVPSLIRKKSEYATLLNSLARLWCHGIALLPSQPKKRPSFKLPHYPWQRKKHWRESKKVATFRVGKVNHSLCGTELFTPIKTWERELNGKTSRIFKDHGINERPIFPAAGYIDTFIDASLKNSGYTQCVLSTVNFESMLNLPKDDCLQIRTVLEEGKLLFFARPYQADGEWQRYASAQCLTRLQSRTSVPLDHYRTSKKGVQVQGSEIYQRLDKAGLNYGPGFQAIKNAYYSKGFVQADIELPAQELCLDETHIQPCVWDAALQLMALLALDNMETALPVSIEKICFWGAHKADAYRIYVKQISNSPYFIQADIVICDADDVIVAFLKGAKAQNLSASGKEKSATDFYKMVWQPDDTEPLADNCGAVNILGPSSDLKDKIIKTLEQNELSNLNLWIAAEQATLAPSPEQAFALMQAAILISEKEEATLVVCTQNAWQVLDGETSNPVAGDLWGVARSIRRELPTLKVCCLDFDDVSLASFSCYLPLLQAGGEYALRKGSLWQQKLLQEQNFKDFNAPLIPYNEQRGLYLETGARGGIEALQFRTQVRKAPISDEVEVRVDHVSLNFKDVLKVFNRLTPQTLEGSFTGDSLGMEAHGVVTRKGPDSTLEIGEPVVFSTKGGAYQSYVTFSPQNALLFRWKDLPKSPAEKASILIAFSTAHYGLRHAAQLRKGETVLLHSATGGVGHAAIVVAHSVGANVIATAGTDEKRAYLRDLGIEHVFDSRSLDFEQQVLAVTDQQGVDVVLNFLTDDFLHASVRLLAPFGRLIEIGKADIGANRALPLGHFDRNLSFIAFDYDNLLKVKKRLAYEIGDELYACFENGLYDVSGVEIYPATETKECFRILAEGNHIGKRVIDMLTLPEQVAAPTSYKNGIQIKATYVVTGAYGGVGLEVVAWLMKQGATSIVMSGRTIHDTARSKQLQVMAQEKGVHLHAMICDVGDRQSVNNLLARHWDYPICGIFHTAAVLDDAPIAEQSLERFEKAYYAKANGAYHLHSLSEDLAMELDYFVLFSSISATLGNHSQINYAGANSYQDALAGYRRSCGLPATSIAWGAIGNVGMLAGNEGVERILIARGINPIDIEVALDKMKTGLNTYSDNFGIFNVDWSNWGKLEGMSIDDPVYDLLHSLKNKDSNLSLLSKLPHLTAEMGQQLLLDFIVGELARVLRRAPDKIRTDLPLADLGIDSLMIVEFQIAIEGELAQIATPNMLDLKKSISSFGERLYVEAVRIQSDQAKFSAKQAEEIDIDSLSDQDVEQMLEQLTADDNEKSLNE